MKIKKIPYVNLKKCLINLSKKRMERIKLSKRIKSVILGTLLGDAALNIQKNFKNARFQMRHGHVQKEYFDWKVQILKSLGTEKAVHFQEPDGYQKKKHVGKWHFQTRALPELTQIFEIVCSSKKRKQIKRSWLNHLTKESLMVLWLDDGSLLRKKGVLCTEGFSKKENLILSKYLKQVWKIDTNVIPILKKRNLPTPLVLSNKGVGRFHHPSVEREVEQEQRFYYRIRINTTNLTKFFRLIIPFIPCASMVYKVCIDYVDPELKQRWISILKQQLPQFSKKILEVYANRVSLKK
uniref:LAGLIDADG DNA endonuclease family protein n=1 Tax=Haematococcus lacustris TaxID=44745 RepID=A0A0S2IDN7_HAELA|nr:LAGLIDADG DNA endonuclease family protein [Haematococcus lacustris]YP_009463667.1 LAGLIDADG DNA endonuclease family protein [Haematococcus lacustris]ALO21605.1 putative LAGLIDADG homing endonuclease [Haematococcus lacustris]AUW36426.1 LAGLIDADG DNA endonuclease family protein [Haematococcus lacustris]AUW36489.1 LAGLIDADG DNA endonuclease family protein [Haematococcus lacustris]